MMRSRVGMVIVCAALGSAAPCFAKDDGGYLDILSPEVVGETGSRTYDIHSDDSDSKFLGNATVKGGHYLGAGFGLRGMYQFETGFLIGGEALVSGGRMYDAQMDWPASSVAVHADVLTQIGWGFHLGPVFLHTATVFGGDWMSFEVTGAPLPKNATSGNVASPLSVGGSSSSATSFSLDRWDLRVGQQVGIRIQVADHVALWADGSYDFDGQWRVRFGVGFGQPARYK